MFLSAISHDVRSYFLTTLDWTEDAVILLPDFSMEEIEEFFKKIFDSELKKCDLFGVLGVFENSSSQNEISPGRPTIKKLVFDETDNQNHEASFSSVEKTVELSIAEIGHNSDFESKKINRKKRKKKVPLTKKVKLGKSVKLAPENVSGESPVFSHPCEHCDRKFKSEDSLFGHVTLKHPEKHEFLQFMVEVNGEFQCTICKKIYPKRRRCNIHIRSKHKIGAKLQCEICQQMFYFKHELELHMVKHTQAKDAYCHLCGKGVRVAANLQRHMIAFHTNKAEKELARTFFCTVCGKGFFTSGALKEHEMLHSDAYNFQCSHCPKTFKQSAGLRTHFKRHHTNFEKTPEQKAKFAAYMQQYRARQREKEKLVTNTPDLENSC